MARLSLSEGARRASRQWRLATLLASLVAGLAAAQDASEEAVAETAPPESAAAPLPPLRSTDLSFQQLGSYGVATLKGVDGSLYLPFGIRLDEAVTAARLSLRYAYSPALLPELSHLKISLNGETIQTVALPREQAGTEQVFSTDIDPRYFTDFNQLRIQLIGHYTLECEDPQHSSLWATISPDSRLSLDLRPLTPADNLALLPAPFFDRHDNRRLELPMVFAAAPSPAEIRSAGVLASWFGALADYRSAHFPVLIDTLPDRHGIVLATNARRPAGLDLTAVERPTLSVRDNPAQAGTKLLVLQGRDEAQLDEAVLALVLGQVALTGSRAEVVALRPPQRRPAYDAPRWVRTDRPVKLGELVEESGQLQVIGTTAPPIRINLRVPPDLLTFQRRGVPIDLRYRYTSPVQRDNSVLSVLINDELVQAYRLTPEDPSGAVDRLTVPLLDQPVGAGADSFLVPAFQVGADNQLSFDFALEAHRDGPCRSSTRDTARAIISPESTIDLSGFPHYTAMPNLALFANASFPFSKYADLAETLLVIPDAALPTQIEDALFLLGRSGRHTGAAATQVQVMTVSQLPEQLDADLLVIDSGESPLLSRWAEALPVRFEADTRRYLPRSPARWFDRDIFSAQDGVRDNPEVIFRTDGAIAALLGFESPLQKGRSVLMMTATEAEATRWIGDVLEDGAQVRQVRGDTVLVRGRALSSHRGTERYYVGELPWWMALWFFLSRNPLLLLLFSIGGALLLAGLLHVYLRRRARQRLAS